MYLGWIRYDARWCVSKDTERKRPGLPGTCGHVVHLGQNMCDALSVSLDRNAKTNELLMSRYILTAHNGKDTVTQWQWHIRMRSPITSVNLALRNRMGEVVTPEKNLCSLFKGLHICRS